MLLFVVKKWSNLYSLIIYDNCCWRKKRLWLRCDEERKGCNNAATRFDSIHSVVFFVFDVPRAEKSSENSVVLEVSLRTYCTVRLQRVAQRVYCTVCKSVIALLDGFIMTIVVEERKGCDCVARKKEKVFDTPRFSCLLKRCSENLVVLEENNGFC